MPKNRRLRLPAQWSSADPVHAAHGRAELGRSHWERQCVERSLALATGWFTRADSNYPELLSIAGLEPYATAIRTFEQLVVPILARTREYAELLIRATRPGMPAAEVATQVEEALGRQAVVLDRADPPTVVVILGEAALQPWFGPEVLRGQCERLLELGERPHVTVRVITHTAGPHPGLGGGFATVTTPGRADVVFVRGQLSGLCTAEPADIRKYREIWARIAELALRPEATRDFLRGRVAELAG